MKMPFMMQGLGRTYSFQYLYTKFQRSGLRTILSSSKSHLRISPRQYRVSLLSPIDELRECHSNDTSHYDDPSDQHYPPQQ